MLRRRRHGDRGFTVVELLIALSIFMLVLAGVFSVFGPSNALYASGQRKVDSQQSARLAMDMMVRQIRMAGYYPENYDTNGPNDIAPANRNSVQLATNNALAIYGAADGCLDANADQVCDDPQPAGRTQVHLFCLSGTSLMAKTGALGAANSYNCAPDSQAVADQQILADNITNLAFTYFAANNNLLAPAPLDGQNVNAIPAFGVVAQRSAVRTVLITLTAQRNVPGQPNETYTLTSSVRLRNP